MRARRAIVHESASCASEVASLIEARSQLLSTVHLVLPEAIQTDVPVLLFSDLDLLLLNEPVDHSARTHGLMIEEIVKLLVVDFEECAFDDNVGLVLPLLDLLEDELDHPRYDAELFILDADGVATSHGEGFPAASLPIGQDGRIVALEAPEDQVLHADLEDILLSRADVENLVEGEGAILPDYQLVFLVVAFDNDVR